MQAYIRILGLSSRSVGFKSTFLKVFFLLNKNCFLQLILTGSLEASFSYCYHDFFCVDDSQQFDVVQFHPEVLGLSPALILKFGLDFGQHIHPLQEHFLQGQPFLPMWDRQVQILKLKQKCH